MKPKRTILEAAAPAPIASPIEDLRRLKRNSTASAAELKEFLAQLRGRSPKEMLGLVASSNLFQSIITATKWTVLVLVVFTLLPFAWVKIFPQRTATPPVAAAPTDAAEKPSSKPSQPSEMTREEKASTAETLGIGEEKSASPDKNPLEGAADDLFKDL